MKLNNNNMNVNFEIEEKDFQGNALKENGKGIIMKDLVCKYLYSCGDGFSADEKYEAYKLLQKINASKGTVDIEDKESLLIKRACEKFLSAGGYGQICELLNGK